MELEFTLHPANHMTAWIEQFEVGEEKEEFPAGSEQMVALTVHDGEGKGPVASEDLTAKEARLFICKEDVVAIGIKYPVTVLSLKPGEDLKHLHLLPHCQYLVPFEHSPPPL